MSRQAEALQEVITELENARANWPPMASAHEGYAILAEEMDELWEQVKINQKRREPAKLRSEAKQVAAMALRFMIDIDDAKARL